MIQKLFAVISALMLLLTCAASLAEEEVAFDTEELDVDITDLVHIAEEETAKDQKDSDGAYIMTVTATGDFTIGGDNYHHKDLFTKELNNHGGDINFVMKNTKDIFLADDLTILNFEGTLTDTKSVPGEKKNNDFLFNISPEYVSVLPDNGVEAVSLDNNHVWDHGEEGLSDTKTALDGAGVIYSTPLEAGIFNYKDQIQVCMLSYNCIDRYGTGFKKDRFKKEYTEEFLQYDTFEDAVCAQITKANSSAIPWATSASPETQSPAICPPSFSRSATGSRTAACPTRISGSFRSAFPPTTSRMILFPPSWMSPQPTAPPSTRF